MKDPKNGSRPLAVLVKILIALNFSRLTKLTGWVNTLHARVHDWRSAWLRTSLR